MKLLNALTAGLLLLSVNLAYGFDEYSFFEKKTGHILSIRKGSAENLEWAKVFCKEFFKAAGGGEVKLDADQQVFGTYDAFIDAKFEGCETLEAHRSKIFNEEKYTFFIVEDSETSNLIGYTIFHQISDHIYSIETQADIKTYDIKSLMHHLALFIKNQVAPDAEFWVSAVRKSMPSFVGILKGCGFGDSDLLHPTLSPEYYQALRLKI